MTTKLRFLFYSMFFVFSLFSSRVSFGHGEDKLGPNGGYIRMPGAFHTEMVKISNQKFKVFLLDVNWKSPTTRNSSIDAKLDVKAELQPISCKVVLNYFECTLSKSTSLKSAKAIRIKAVRDGVEGGFATYKLPLKLFSHE